MKRGCDSGGFTDTHRLFSGNAGPVIPPSSWGSMVVKALIERTGVDANAIDEVILGQGTDGWRRAESGARQSAISDIADSPFGRHYV
ncbi:hypothetical protein KCP69_07595 [Salmonella enterica subsp. enterica]|nr:hypothetical protein KCP69_07595 [Salmonella enterica subsp. enterica]